MLTNRYKLAMQYAATVHDGHLRKETEIAYLSHLLSASALVMESGGNEDEAIAALLHDAIEDRGDSYRSQFEAEPRTGRAALKRDIELQFGATVLHLIEQCTDDEYLPAGKPAEKGTAEEWRKRKKTYIDALGRKTEVGVLRVSCADKLHNARAILADYETEGESVWNRFRTHCKKDQVWYYGELVRVFRERSQAIGDAGLRRLARQLAAVVAAIGKHQPA
jgi:(p)ppGpp synthase/HD superfamily hydrolase